MSETIFTKVMTTNTTEKITSVFCLHSHTHTWCMVLKNLLFLLEREKKREREFTWENFLSFPLDSVVYFKLKIALHCHTPLPSSNSIFYGHFPFERKFYFWDFWNDYNLLECVLCVGRALHWLPVNQSSLWGNAFLISGIIISQSYNRSPTYSSFHIKLVETILHGVINLSVSSFGINSHNHFEFCWHNKRLLGKLQSIASKVVRRGKNFIDNQLIVSNDNDSRINYRCCWVY